MAELEACGGCWGLGVVQDFPYPGVRQCKDCDGYGHFDVSVSPIEPMRGRCHAARCVQCNPVLTPVEEAVLEFIPAGEPIQWRALADATEMAGDELLDVLVDLNVMMKIKIVAGGGWQRTAPDEVVIL